MVVTIYSTKYVLSICCHQIAPLSLGVAISAGILSLAPQVDFLSSRVFFRDLALLPLEPRKAPIRENTYRWLSHAL